MILQKGLFARLDAVAIYTVVASTLHFPPCQLLSKVVYHLLDNLLIYKDDKKAALALRGRDESIDTEKEIKKRQKVISKFLTKRMRDILFDTRKHVRIRRLVAEALATLCVGDERACTYLAEGENAPMVGALLRNSTDAVLRVHLADIIRHLTANKVELNQIWDKTDEAVMDFPSSAGLTTPNVHKLFDSMDSIVAEAETTEVSAKIYRIKDIRVPGILHSGSGNPTLVLDEDLTIFIPGRNQLFSNYEMPIRQHADLEETDIAGTAPTLNIKLEENKGFWFCRGKKHAVSAITIQFPEEGLRNAFIKDFRSVQARLSGETPITHSTSQQETQALSLPLLRISEDADGTDIEDVLPSSPARTRTGKPLPPHTDVRIAKAQQPPSNDVVHHRDSSSKVFEKQDATKDETRGDKSKTSIFMERVTSESLKQKTPRLTKKDERSAQKPPGTSPLQKITGNALRSRKAAKLGADSESQNENDPVLTFPLAQQRDADYEDSNNQNTANMPERDFQQSVEDDEETGEYQNLDRLPSIQRTTPKDKFHSLARNWLVHSTVSEDLSGSLNGKEPSSRLNEVKSRKAKPSLVRTGSVEEQMQTKSNTQNLSFSKKPDVDWDEHLRSEQSVEEARERPRKGKGDTEQRNSNSASANAKATKGRDKVTKSKNAKLANRSTMKEASQSASPKPARRSKRAVAKSSKVYVEDGTEDNDVEAVQEERPASAVASPSKPKAKARKSCAAPTNQSNDNQKEATVAISEKAEAIIINSSDDENNSAARNPLSRNGHNQAAEKQQPTVSEPVTSYANGIEDDNDEVVQDSFLRIEDSFERTADPAVNVESKPGTKISARDTTSVEDEHEGVDNTKPVQQTFAKGSVTTTTRRSEKARQSTHHGGFYTAVLNNSKGTSLVHFNSQGPVDQGPSQAETPLEPAQRDKATNCRRTSGHKSRPDLTEQNLNSFKNNTTTSRRKCDHHKGEESRNSANTESIAMTNVNVLTRKSIAERRLCQEQRFMRNNEYMENTDEQHDEIELFGEEVASEELNATSSAIVVNYDNHKPAIAPSINAEPQSPPPAFQANCPQRSANQSDIVSDPEEGSTDNSSSEDSSEESEFEVSLPIDQSPQRKVTRPTRQATAITGSIDLKRQSVSDVVDTDNLHDPFTAEPKGSHWHGKTAQVSGQMSVPDDMIARMARDCNPGAQKDIHFQGLRPDKITQNMLYDISQRFNADDSMNGTSRVKVITSKGGSPRRAHMLKDPSMPPPPKPSPKSGVLDTGDRGVQRVTHSDKAKTGLCPSKPDNNGSDNRTTRVKRIRRSTERSSTPIVVPTHQSTPLPFAVSLVERSSPVSRSRTEEILENNNRSETGETTLVDTSLLIRHDEPGSPSLFSSRPSEASASPQPDLQARSYLNDQHEQQGLSSVGNTFQRNIQQNILAITQVSIDCDSHRTRLTINSKFVFD